MIRQKTCARDRTVWALALWAGTVFGCGPSSDTDSRASPSAVTDSPSSVEGCEVVAAGPPASVPDPNGPYYHQVVYARTADGITLTDAHQVLDHASVPDGVLRRDGSILIYYVNDEDGSVWVARVSGELALPIGPLSLNGVERPGVSSTRTPPRSPTVASAWCISAASVPPRAAGCAPCALPTRRTGSASP